MSRVAHVVCILYIKGGDDSPTGEKSERQTYEECQSASCLPLLVFRLLFFETIAILFSRQIAKMYTPTTTVTLEEHAIFPSLGSSIPFYSSIWKLFPSVHDNLADHSKARLTDMDTGHVSFQVMSHLPGLAGTNVVGCRVANDEMATAITKHSDRLAGFAALPMAFPEEAAKELERVVRELGFVGAMIDNHLEDGSHYDDEKFWPVFRTAERLDVPIYIHPAPPSERMVSERFEGKYNDLITMGLSTGIWGWHENVGLHVLKLYAAGLFGQFPKLKIVIGHMGEMLPMMVDRIDELQFFKKGGLPGFKKVWENNIWVTSSGIFSVRTLEMLRKVQSMDHILYSIDTPFNSGEKGWTFIRELVASEVFSEEEMNMFVSENAKRLLKLRL